MNAYLHRFLGWYHDVVPRVLMPAACGCFMLGIISIGVGVYVVFRSATPHDSGEIPIQPQEETESTPSGQMRTIDIDVSGGVKTPGLITLETGLRVGDAIASAGGFAKDADLSVVHKQINMAKKLADGEKVYVPVIGDDVSGLNNEATSETALVNLNTASTIVLQTLKGIGAVRADAIIKNRPYTSIDELQQKAGIPASVIEGIRTQVEL